MVELITVIIEEVRGRRLLPSLLINTGSESILDTYLKGVQSVIGLYLTDVT
jgi:hypothetical protein